MNILFLGDIVGRPGRDIIFHYLPILKKEHTIDFTVVNGENSAHGKGITKRIYNSFKEAGIDVITLGNHAYSKKEITEHIAECPDLVFPYNYANDFPKEPVIKEVDGLSVCVCNILGTAFMMDNAMSAYKAMDEILVKYKADLYLVDLHAEATAEKILFAHYYQDKLVACLGTHTHVQTADERLIGKLAYISDVGMNGVYDSIIGRDANEMIDAIIHGKKTRYQVADGPAMLCGVVITVDPKTRQATAIKRLQIRP